MRHAAWPIELAQMVLRREDLAATLAFLTGRPPGSNDRTDEDEFL